MQIRFLSVLFILMFMPQYTVLASMPCKKIQNVDGNKEWNKDAKKFLKARFKRSCYLLSKPEGNFYCVKLTDVQVQSMAQAIRIAKAYAKERYNDDIACYPYYYSSCVYDFGVSADDHMLCATADNSAHYEFVFDDISEKRDARYKKGIGTAVCKLYMGDDSIISKHTTHDSEAWKYNSVKDEFYHTNNDKRTRSHDDYLVCEVGDTLVDRSVSEYNKTCEVSDCSNSTVIDKFDLVAVQNEKMKGLLENYFGYTIHTEYSKSLEGWGTANITKPVIDFRTAKECPADVDKTFVTQQINLDQGVVAWLGGYWSGRAKKDIKTFRCDLAARTCHTGELFNARDNLLDCYAEYMDGKQEQITFQFNDLSEGNKTYNKGAQSMMQCMQNDGATFDGRRCRGLSESECWCGKGAAPCGLDKTIKDNGGAGTRWDTELQSCVLIDSEKAYDKQRRAELNQTVGVAIVGTAIVVVTVVGSGGTATPIVLAVAGTAFTAAAENETRVQRKKTDKFLSDIEQCDPAKVDCAYIILDKYVKEISFYTDNLTTDQLNAIDALLEKKLDGWVGDDPEQQAAFYARMTQAQDPDVIEAILSGEVPASVARQIAFNAMAIVCDFLSVKSLTKGASATFMKRVDTAAKGVYNTLPRTGQKIIKLTKDAAVFANKLNVGRARVQDVISVGNFVVQNQQGSKKALQSMTTPITASMEQIANKKEESVTNGINKNITGKRQNTKINQFNKNKPNKT